METQRVLKDSMSLVSTVLPILCLQSSSRPVSTEFRRLRAIKSSKFPWMTIRPTILSSTSTKRGSLLLSQTFSKAAHKICLSS